MKRAMSGEIVKLKGNRFGLQLVFDKNSDFESIRSDIQEKLETGSRFFRRGTVIYVAPGALSKVNEGVLRKLFHRHGVLFRVEEPKAPEARVPKEKPPERAAEDAPEEKAPSPAPKAKMAQKPAGSAGKPEMTVVNRTLRSGQEIRSKGDVMICGNVNPGAQIIAGGSVDIRGTLKGTVHAGAYGDTSAFVAADRLVPMQIRIADRMAELSDDRPTPSFAERASIKDGKIVIEPIERQESKE